MKTPKQIKLEWKNAYRIIPSRMPSVNFFEELVDSELLNDLFELESMTNDRLRDEYNIGLVAKEDLVYGPGSTPIMAAFTHISKFKPSRFSDGSYGVYYAAKDLETAIFETVYHTERFMRRTAEAPDKLQKRVYTNKVCKPMCDLRISKYKNLHDPDPSNYNFSQEYARELREELNPWGFVYNSVRHPGGQCLAAFRPPAVSIPKQAEHLVYDWDGEHIKHIYKYSEINVRL